MSQLPAFLPGLLAEVGQSRSSIQSVEPLNTGVTNRTSLVRLQDDTRYILREYEWPYDTDDDLQRVEKELYLHDLLLKHDVPVPAIVAHHDEESGRAVLMEFKPGQLLGNMVGSLTDGQRAQTWRDVGAALRKVHSIQLPDHCAGLIVGERIQPFAAGPGVTFITTRPCGMRRVC